MLSGSRNTTGVHRGRARPSDEVKCTYMMQNAWSQAIGVGPFTGSSFRFVIADGQIRKVKHNFSLVDARREANRVIYALRDRRVIDALDLMRALLNDPLARRQLPRDAQV